MVTILFTDLQAFIKQTSLCHYNPSVPMSTSGRNNFLSPPLADSVPRLPPINNIIVGSNMPQPDLPNLASGGNAHVDNAKTTVVDPPQITSTSPIF